MDAPSEGMLFFLFLSPQEGIVIYIEPSNASKSYSWSNGAPAIQLATPSRLALPAKVPLETVTPIPLQKEFELASLETNEYFTNLLHDINEGTTYHSPELIEEGVNGVYALKASDGKALAIFKPNDEQGDSEKNPKRNAGTKMGYSFSASAAAREQAAYLLDRTGFYGVPKTTQIIHRNGGNVRLGSLQEYIENEGSCGDFGPSQFPVDEVHKIGILDLQILNTDRHDGNILVTEGMKLVPIDHGFSLPPIDELATATESLRFEWMNWPQSKKPFSPAALQHIASFDIDESCKVLKRIGIENSSILTFRICCSLLKKGASAGLTLNQIGNFFCGTDAPIIAIYKEAKLGAENSDAKLLAGMSRRIDEEILRLAPK